MEKGDLTETSRYISYVLRPRPDAAGTSLDEHGWADVDELIAVVSREHSLDRDPGDDC